MTYQEFSQYAVFFGSLGMVIGLWAQAIKIFQTKSAKDFSWVIVFFLALSESVWLNFGIAWRQWPVIGVSITTIPAVAVITVGFIKYRHGNLSETGGED